MHTKEFDLGRFSQPDVLILACLGDEPKTATAWHEAAVEATGRGIEPGAFSRMVARLERRGLVEALLVIAGMMVVCIATGAGLLELWNVLPLLNEFSQGWSFLLPFGFIMMVAAIVIACVALVRSTLQLRAASAPGDNTSALPLRASTGPKNWIIVLPAVVFVYIELTSIGSFGPFGLLLIPPLFMLGSVLFVLAVKRSWVKGAVLAKEEPLSQVQQVHEHD